MFVQRDTARTERDHHEQAADHGERLEEVVLEEIACRVIGRDAPELGLAEESVV